MSPSGPSAGRPAWSRSRKSSGQYCTRVPVKVDADAQDQAARLRPGVDAALKPARPYRMVIGLTMSAVSVRSVKAPPIRMTV